MNNLDISYQQLLKHILQNGSKRGDRTGTGTISVFGEMLTHDMSKGFPLLTTKKMAVKTMITELKWFLKGRTDIEYLRENGCKIWDGDYEKSGRTDGQLGPIYGKQWRQWKQFIPYDITPENCKVAVKVVDQIANLINDLKTNPNSRRHIVSAWNVGELDQMTLPPCHYGFQCYVDNGKLSLMWSQRSVDTFLGLPFNISSYALLLLLLCEETGLKPGILKGSLGDTHLYQNHEDAAITQLKRVPYDLPTMKVSNVDILNGEFDWELIDYKSHPRIKAPLSN